MTPFVCKTHNRYVRDGERCPYCLGADEPVVDSVVAQILANLAVIRDALRRCP